MVSPPQIEKCGDKAKRISAAGQQKFLQQDKNFRDEPNPKPKPLSRLVGF